MVCRTSSSNDPTATSRTCALFRLPSPTTAWSRVPSRMLAQPVRCSRPDESVDGRGWIGLRSVNLSPGPLCRDEDFYVDMSVTELFDIYSSSIIEALDRLTPMHDVASRYRTSTPWCDADCRSIKRGAIVEESLSPNQASGRQARLDPGSSGQTCGFQN